MKKFLMGLCGLLLAACSTTEPTYQTLQPVPTHLVQPAWHISNTQQSLPLKLFMASANGVGYLASANGNLTAISLQTGVKQWHHHYEVNFSSGPVYADHQLFFGTDKGAVAISINGKLTWRQDLGNGVVAPPGISANKVIVRTVTGSVYALNISDGQLIWHHDFSGQPSFVLQSASQPLIQNQWVYVGLADGSINRLNLNNGQLQQTIPLTDSSGLTAVDQMRDSSADLVWQNNLLYVAFYNSNLYALHLPNLTPAWQYPISTINNIAHPNLFIMTDTRGNLTALNPHTGKLVWQQTELQGRTLTAPQCIGSLVAVGDNTGFLSLYAINDGHLVGRILVDKAGIRVLKVYQSLFIMGTNNNTVYAYRG